MLGGKTGKKVVRKFRRTGKPSVHRQVNRVDAEMYRVLHRLYDSLELNHYHLNSQDGDLVRASPIDDQVVIGDGVFTAFPATYDDDDIKSHISREISRLNPVNRKSIDAFGVKQDIVLTKSQDVRGMIYVPMSIDLTDLSK